MNFKVFIYSRLVGSGYKFIYTFGSTSAETSIPPPLQDVGLPVDGVALLGGGVVLLVHLDGLVRLAGDEPGAGVVVRHGEDAGLGVERAGLDGRLELQWRS